MNALPKHSSSWNKITPPLRPTEAVVWRMRDLSTDGPALLFGVTPEFCLAFDDITAVDNNADMIARVWPGDTDNKRAILGEWASTDWPENRFATIVGDGAMTLLDSLSAISSIQRRAFSWLQPGGTFVHRVFECPDEPITIEELADQLSKSAIMNWNAFKLRMMYYQAQNDGGINSLSQVLDLFNSIAPDRDAVCDATGWNRDLVDTIDLYQGINTVACKPTRAQWMSTIPDGAVNLQFYHVDGYDLAGTCPIMVWEKP